MRKLALALAIGAASILGASAVSAAPVKKQTQAPAASHSDSAKQDTDMSSHRRHWRHRHWHHRHSYYRPYYRSYGYYPRYYQPAPVISFGFGGGPRYGWGGHRRHFHHW